MDFQAIPINFDKEDCYYKNFYSVPKLLQLSNMTWVSNNNSIIKQSE